MKPVLRIGYDFREPFQVRTLNRAMEDFSTATLVECAVKTKTVTGSVEIIADTAQANTGGAAWATGVLEIFFPASSTGISTAYVGDAWIEVRIVKNSEAIACRDIPIDIEIGVQS